MVLLKNSAYVDGHWVGAISGEEFAVLNPADGSVIARVPDMSSEDAVAAIHAAQQAQRQWQQQDAVRRSARLSDWHALIIDYKDELARLITLEQGKPLAESFAEVAYGASFVSWFAAEAERDRSELLDSPDSTRAMSIVRQPVGVVGAITPWNFPVAMVTRKCAPALAAGCTILLKPAEATPLSALALAELAERAGIPAGVFNVLTCSSGERVGNELTQNPIIRKLSFTGSTVIGKELLEACSGTVKSVSMELGGNAPFIVFDDADLDLAVAGIIASKFRNTGQTCISANRIYVQESVYPDFLRRLVSRVKGLQVGPGDVEGVNQGPLIDAGALEKVERHVADALAHGAELVCGGNVHELGGTFYEPTILGNVTPAMLIAREETFGPVAPLFRFTAEAEAIENANATESGLAAYVYSSDAGRAQRVAQALEYGMVGINEANISTVVAPFGGIKESGIGREGSHYGIDEYLEMKYLCAHAE